MSSSHTLVSLKNKMPQPVIWLWNVSSMSECLFLFWSVWFRPLPIYPVVFQHPGSPVGGKHCVLQPWRPANELGQRSQFLPDLKSFNIHLNCSVNRGILKHRWINSTTYSSLVICAHSCCVFTIWQPMWALSARREGSGEINISHILNLDCSTHFNR